LGVRAEQKEKTRQALIEAAFSQLSGEKSFSSLSLREVSREAGIAPTSFYRHFRDMNELGLTMVDEAGLTLRQLMRSARERIASGGSIIHTSVDTFMEFIDNNSDVFRLLLRERSGTSAAFRSAVQREIQHFSAEMSDYLCRASGTSVENARIEADAMVTIVFNAGAEALDLDKDKRIELAERVKMQLRFITKGANSYRKRP
jgi:AcrR family transcriptional regulator